MEFVTLPVLAFQAAIFLSIRYAAFGISRLKWAVGWTAFSLWQIILPPLLVFQLVVIWGSYWYSSGGKSKTSAQAESARIAAPPDPGKRFTRGTSASANPVYTQSSSGHSQYGADEADAAQQMAIEVYAVNPVATAKSELAGGITGAAPELPAAAAQTTTVQNLHGLDVNEKLLQAQEKVAFLGAVEARAFLLRSLEQAVRRLLIISPWVDPVVVDRFFLNSLISLADRGVTIHIGYGYGGPNRQSAPKQETAVSALHARAYRYRNIVVGDLNNTHAKLLIVDDSAVCGSFNWLSFRGERWGNETRVRDEQVVVVSEPSRVENAWEDRRREIDEAARSGR